MDHASTPYFIVAAVWNSMEHRECIGGGEKTKQQLSNWWGWVRAGNSDKRGYNKLIFRRGLSK